MHMAQPRWPNGAKAAVSFTMDNLGEAQEVNRGVWPAGQPIGSHYAVKEKLPRMLDVLDKHGVKGTYFAESWSLDVYPDAVAELSRRGHEVAWHGFQHETWTGLSAEEEELNFRKSFAKAAEHSVKYEGFRPPGGSIDKTRTYDLLRQHGIKYASPLGELGVQQGIVILPFEWETVDAFYYMDKFAGIRESHGAQKDVMSPNDFKRYLLSKMEEVVRTNGYISILFHPFLQLDEEKFAVLDEVLARISGDPDIWCASCNHVADWVLAHPESFPSDKSP